MESVLLKANLVILSTGQYWLIFNGEKGMSDCEGHGHKAVVYKSHFPTTKALHSHSVVTETPADTLANEPRLLQRPKSLLSLPHDTLNSQHDLPSPTIFQVMNLIHLFAPIYNSRRFFFNPTEGNGARVFVQDET